MGEHQQREDPAAPRQTRRDLLLATRDAKLDALFRGRVYDIVRKIDLPDGQVFISVLGNTAQRGYVLRERITQQEVAVGHKLLRHIHDKYLAVSLPYKPRRSRRVVI